MGRREIKEEECVEHREGFKASPKCSPGLAVGGSNRVYGAFLEAGKLEPHLGLLV